MIPDKNVPIVSKHISVNGIQMHVLLHNTTTRKQHVLVLLHGFTGSAMGWNSLLNDLAGPDLQVIAIDMLGHGNLTYQMIRSVTR